MTPISESRLQHELHMGWRPLVIQMVRGVNCSAGVLLHERLYDAQERAGAVYAMVGAKAVQVRADEYAVLAWGLSEECLRRIGAA